MGTVHEITKLTDNRFVNLYHFKATSIHNTPVNYYVASRAKTIQDMKVNTRKNTPDGVVIYSIYGKNHDQVVLVRQYRYSIGDYIYEFPAGLVEPAEDYKTAAIRELKEETGLNLQPIDVPEEYEKPFYTTIGLTDESCATVYGYADGTPDNQGEEDTEEIEIVLADRDEVRRILKEENVALICAYMLMHFLKDTDDPFGFLK